MNLSTKVGEVSGIGGYYSQKLEILGIKTINDFIYHFPFRYKDLQDVKRISQVRPNEVVSIQGQIVRFSNIYTKTGKRMQEAVVSDGEREIYAVWFNQTYLAKMLTVGTAVSLAGKVSFWNRKLAIIAPDFEKLGETNSAIHTQGLVPIYPETQGISSKWIRNKLSKLLPGVLGQIKDPLPDTLRKKYNLEPLTKSLQNIHFPKDLASDEAARYRLSFDELLKLQLISGQRRKYWENNFSSIKRKKGVGFFDISRVS